MKYILIFIVLTMLCFNCNENQSLTVDRIIDNRPIVGEPNLGKDIKLGEYLPKFIYHKINEQSFVKERMAVLEEKGINYIFWVNKSNLDTNKIDIQLLSENETRWTPNYNFMYDYNTEQLFHQGISKKTLNDSLILLK